MKDEVIVVGSGGHAKVCIELLRAMGRQVDYCVSVADSPDICMGVPVLKGNDHLIHLRDRGYKNLFVALGSNRLRQRLANMAIELGYHLINAISPQAIISQSARVGNGVAIMAGAIINAESVIDDLVIINTGATIDHDCRIGHAAHVAPQCGLAGNVIIGEASFLGIGCKVIPKVQIGKDVIIGAGSVVIKNISSDATAMGVPARILLNKGAENR